MQTAGTGMTGSMPAAMQEENHELYDLAENLYVNGLNERAVKDVLGRYVDTVTSCLDRETREQVIDEFYDTIRQNNER